MEKLKELRLTVEKKLQEMDENNSKAIITRIKLENVLSEIDDKINNMNNKAYINIKNRFDEIVINLEDENINTFTLFRSNIITKEEVVDRIVKNTISILEKDLVNGYTISRSDDNQSSTFMFNVVKLLDYIKEQILVHINNYELA